MRIAEILPKPNWVLSIVADDGRIGNFDVVPTRSMKLLKPYKIKTNSQRFPMANTLLNGIVALIYQLTQLRHDGRKLVKQLETTD